MVFFCGPAANKFLFSSESKVVATWWPSTFNKLFHSNSSFTSSTSTGVKTKSVRDVVSGFLKMDVLQNYVSTIDSIAREHIEKEWEPKEGKVVVVEAVKKYTLVLACQLLVGIKDHEHWVGFGERFASVLAGIVSVTIDFPGTTFSKAIKDAQFLRKELVVIIRERKTRLKKEENPTVHDLLSGILLTLDANGKFRTEEDTAGQIMGLLIAGHETASVALTFTIKYLAELPHVYQEVFKEIMEIAKAKGPGELLNWGDIKKMSYTWNVTCEAMRLAPPAQMGFKEALSDFTFAGFTIPKGWKACWSVHSTNKDPNYFPNPEEFDPTRFEGNGPAPYTYVPFGGGQRICLGREYARLELLVFIYNLVKKFEWKKLVPNERITFNPSPSPENGLPICLKPHDTSST
ncbi:hypothetical protein Vadar_025790 [Vaccinium darrowii]|uniref:Uncharacterized protein n=1 Tax=Vaccinium darrowii TaxID=229202 RepID=A0ACB7X432_9ERIC|nr:hypothetical protein Vadar_025790 [Vaccinium darrowii]